MLVFFVRRVQGVPPGIYALLRVDDSRAASFRGWCRDMDFERASADLPLFRVVAADEGAVARAGTFASGGQGLGGNGAFSVALVARFEAVLREEGSFAYRRLHWECGALAHAMYLACELIGSNGCAMGYFFAEKTHAILGAEGGAWECLLWFGAGRGVHDPRVRTLAPP